MKFTVDKLGFDKYLWTIPTWRDSFPWRYSCNVVQDNIYCPEVHLLHSELLRMFCLSYSDEDLASAFNDCADNPFFRFVKHYLDEDMGKIGFVRIEFYDFILDTLSNSRKVVNETEYTVTLELGD